MSDARTSPHEMNRSGWWFISLAIGVSRFTKSTAPVKSPNLNSRRRLLPYFSQPSSSSPSLAWTSSSLRTDIYSPHSMPTHSLVIEAEPAVCFDEITDYETFPEWQAAVKEVDVLSRDGSGFGRDVRFVIDAKVRVVSYTLRYSYEQPRLVTWDYLDGDVKSVDGEFVFEERGDGATLATYSLDI